ncbi:MAG: WbqC family protein [Thaumarchaeota archaeon]|nr:WbqC family protein [Nitrososphaerota archaeon]
MRVAIHQPQFLPYPGFFHKLSLVDEWVVMDDAQYDKRFTNRNRILAPSGPIWLTVPIDKAQKFSKNSEVRVNNSMPWREEHWKKISYSYRNAKGFLDYGPYFEDLYRREHDLLLELDLETTKQAIRWLDIPVKLVLESDLGVKSQGTQRLVDVCEAVGADTYVSGPGGRGYMDEPLFASRHMALEYTDYAPVPYRQRFGETFVPDLSILDLLFNAGAESRRYVISGEEARAQATSGALS